MPKNEPAEPRKKGVETPGAETRRLTACCPREPRIVYNVRVRGGRDDRRGAWAGAPGSGGKPTGLKASVEGPAAEESPDSTGRDGG